MLSSISSYFNKRAIEQASNWIEKHPAKVSNAILLTAESAMVISGAIGFNPTKVAAGTIGVKAAWDGFWNGDTTYDITLSNPLLKSNPSYVPGGVSDWTGWAEGNIDQYSLLSTSAFAGFGGDENPMDALIGLPGLAAFKLLTIKDPAKQVFEIASTLDKAAYQSENNQPIKKSAWDRVLQTANSAGSLLNTIGQDAIDIARFTKDHGGEFFGAIPGQVLKRSQELGQYIMLPSVVAEDVGQWVSTWEMLQSKEYENTHEKWKTASTLREKLLYGSALSGHTILGVADGLLHKGADIFRLPFNAVFKILEEPSAKIAEAAKNYGIDRGVDGKKVLSERIQNYTEIPYFGVALGKTFGTLATGNLYGTLREGLDTVVGAGYFISNAYQRKSGNVPGLDLDLPVYLHRPQDFEGRFLHGIDENIPQYKELLASIKIILASESDYIRTLETAMRDNPQDIFEIKRLPELKLDDPARLKAYLKENPALSWDKNPDGSYNLDPSYIEARKQKGEIDPEKIFRKTQPVYRLNQLAYFQDLQKAKDTTSVEGMFVKDADGYDVIDPVKFVAWLNENNTDPNNPKVEWAKDKKGEYIVAGLDNVGYAILKDPTMKISIAQIVGLPDLREWPDNKLPDEATPLIERARAIKEARERGEIIKGRIPIPGQDEMGRPAMIVTPAFLPAGLGSRDPIIIEPAPFDLKKVLADLPRHPRIRSGITVMERAQISHRFGLDSQDYKSQRALSALLLDPSFYLAHKNKLPRELRSKIMTLRRERPQDAMIFGSGWHSRHAAPLGPEPINT